MKHRIPQLCSALAVSAAIVLVLSVAASAQITTTQFATGVATPAGGVVLSGTAINPSTGQPFRHLWTADGVNGLCRYDPDLDNQTTHTLNAATCLSTIQGVALSAGEVVFDPTTNDLYVLDGGGKLGIFRLHYIPSGDSGQGSLDTVHEEVLGGSIVGGKLSGGCNIQLNVPSTISLGPDGNLYVGFSHVGTIMRILAPQTEPLPCSNVQNNVASTSDGKRATGLAWMGHTLFGGDGRGTFAISNADQCFTPQNGFVACPPALSGIFLQIASPTAVTSDQVYPALNGTSVYFGTSTQVFQFKSNLVSSYGGPGFSFVSALVVDPGAASGEAVYAGDDPSNGLVASQGRWWEIAQAPPAPAPPATPVNVTATAGNAQATVSWNPVQNGQLTTSYTVRDTFASNGVLVPDTIVTAPAGTSVVPTSATIGLVNGVSYQFAVAAVNTQGSSAFSTPSNLVTPQAPTVPSAPAAVVATAGDASAVVIWTASASNGSAITSYTVTAYVNGVATGIVATVPGSSTGANVTGLTNGTTYTFTVHATNALGNSPESAPSPPVTPQVITAPGAPTGVTAVAGNAQATVSWTPPANNGGAAIAAYTVSAQTGGVTVLSVVVSGTTTSTVVSGLTNGTTYVFVVLATNQAGTSPASLPSNAVTPTAPPPTSTTDIQVVGQAQNGGPAVTNPDTFTWQIKNNQSPTANLVSFSTSLAPWMVFQSVSSNMGSCSGPAAGTAGAVVQCSLNALAGGQTMVVTVNVTFNATGTMSTTGSATFSGTDTNPANNSFSVTIGVK